MALLIGLVGLGGCDALESEPAPTDAETKAKTEPAAPEPAVEAPPAPPPSLMVGVLDRAIQPPPEGGSTYRVDAYVAALVVEQLRRSPLPFSSWRDEQPDPSRPSAGYRLGPVAADSAWARLGLQEGDIVVEVNGVPTTDEGWTTEALSRGENRVTVGVFRDDVSFVLSYRLMGGMAWFGMVDEQQPPEPGPADEPDVDVVAVAPGADGGGSRGGGARGSSGSRSPSSLPSSGGRKPSTGGGSTSPRPSGSAKARCTSASQCTVDGAHFDSLVRSPAKLESQANVVPAIRNDVFSGYRLKSVRPGSTVHQLGFRSGDKVTHINGYDLTNDLEAMQLYMGLSSTKTFRVRYVRGGATRNKTIKVV